RGALVGRADHAYVVHTGPPHTSPSATTPRAGPLRARNAVRQQEQLPSPKLKKTKVL
ncbi:hypothetical protein Cantr_01007, partial [Candida viswanathii]